MKDKHVKHTESDNSILGVRPGNHVLTREGPFVRTIKRSIWFVMIILIVNLLTLTYDRIDRRQQSDELFKAEIENQAKIDVMRQQWAEYVQRTIQRWDSLVKQNPGLKVPGLHDEPLPAGSGKLTERELKSSITSSPSPSPSPSPVSKKTKIHKRSHPKPEPKPWWKYIF